MCQDPPNAKAQGVLLLKKMAADARYGPSVRELLDREATWDAYRLQDHDLFLAAEGNTHTQIAQAGPRIGLLTQ